MEEEDFIEGLDEDEELDGNLMQMNSNSQNSKMEANWNTVLQFLKDKQRDFEMKETEWMIEKQKLQQEINTLKAQNTAYENSTKDSMRRIQMLEFALRQERIKYAKAANGLESKVDILKDHPEAIQISDLPERQVYQKPQGHQSILIKFLEEVGFEEVFNSADVNDIKDLFSKATSSLSKNKELLDTVSKIEEEVKARIEKEEKASESLEDQLKELNDKDQLNSLLSNFKSTKEDTKLRVEDEEMHDNFNASFESVKRDDDEVSINASYADKMSEIKLKHEFNVHLDSVRGVRFIRSLDCMASVSEDCTVKLWDVKLMHKNMEDGFGQGIDFKGDPYFTLRGHTGPLFKITGSCIDDRIIYTAGIEGTVKIWKVPDVDSVDIFGQEQDKYDFWLGTLNGHNNEPIWDLRHHPSLPMLLSMGADDSLWLWRAYSEDDKLKDAGELKNHEQLLQRFNYSTPACCDWLYSNLSFFMVSFVQGHMTIFDMNSGQSVSKIIAESTSNKPDREKQINTLVWHPTSDVAITGTEDGTWSIYNLSNSKWIKHIVDAHDDGISWVALSANKHHFYTGSHDGSIKFWDMRNYKCFGEIQAHGKKYDEAVMSMMVHPNHPVLVTCGADASIKWFETDPKYFPKKK